MPTSEAQKIANARYRAARAGTTVAHVAILMERQGNKCAICKTTSATESGKKGWHLDHNHSTGRVRGVLCHGCNIGLGHLRDDPARCRAAADYLEHHAELGELL